MAVRSRVRVPSHGTKPENRICYLDHTTSYHRPALAHRKSKFTNIKANSRHQGKLFVVASLYKYKILHRAEETVRKGTKTKYARSETWRTHTNTLEANQLAQIVSS